VEIINAFADPETETIVIESSAQIGKTTMLLIMMLYAIAVDPAPILYIGQSDNMVKDFSIRRLAPMIRLCVYVNRLVSDAKSRDSANTLNMKTFPGGSIALTGANSPAELRSRPIRRTGARK
jgi:phage terminase large subunit GpA-like protein